MSANAPAWIALAVALLALAVILLTANARAATRDDRRRLGDMEGEDDLMGLADTLFQQPVVHRECRIAYQRGAHSHVHRQCLDQLRREERR